MVRIRPFEEKIEAIYSFGEAHRNYHEAERIFNEKFPDHPITRKYLRELVGKFNRTGSVRREGGAGRKSIPEETKVSIIAEMVVNPQQSTSRVASTIGVSTATVKKYLKKHKFHPYKLVILHQLTEDDPDRRMEFCEIMEEKIARNPNYIRNICFSDESTFFLNGNVNTQNVRYWSDTNPHIFREGHTQFPQKLNVWAGILGDHIVGPLFLEENLNGNLYLDLLRDTVEPLILQILEDNDNEFEEHITFQQDGAPPHFQRQVREYLDVTYPMRWIGRRGPIEWPARSPDLTPCDFFLWGYVKSKVYEQQSNSLEELKQRITRVCADISADMLNNVRQEFSNRIFYCQEVLGGHFEHLIR